MARMVTGRSQNEPKWPHYDIVGWSRLTQQKQAKTSDQQVIEALVRSHWRQLTLSDLTDLARAYDLTAALATVRREAGA